MRPINAAANLPITVSWCVCIVPATLANDFCSTSTISIVDDLVGCVVKFVPLSACMPVGPWLQGWDCAGHGLLWYRKHMFSLGIRIRVVPVALKARLGPAQPSTSKMVSCHGAAIQQCPCAVAPALPALAHPVETASLLHLHLPPTMWL